MTPFDLHPELHGPSERVPAPMPATRPGANALTPVAELDALEFSLRHRLQLLLIEAEMSTDPAQAERLRAQMAPLEAQLAGLPVRR